MPAVLVMAGTLCGHGAWTYWRTAALYPTTPASVFYPLTYNKDLPPYDRMSESYNVNGFHLGHFLLNTMRRSHNVSTRDVQREIEIASLVYNPKTSPLVLDVAMLHGLEIMPHSDAFAKGVADAILRKAPRRTDLLIAYVTRLLQQGQFQTADLLITQMKKSHRRAPAVLWMRSLFAAKEGHYKKAQRLQRRALQAGIDRWIRVAR
jgi:hypothetical protein